MAKKFVTKERLLTGIEKIYQEYKDGEHTLDINTCPLCQMFKNNYVVNTCGSCPMAVFDGEHSYPCVNRICRPVNCQGYFKDEKLLKKYLPLDIDFYRAFVRKVRTMTDADIQATDWKFLRAIDKRVGKKHLG